MNEDVRPGSRRHRHRGRHGSWAWSVLVASHSLIGSILGIAGSPAHAASLSVSPPQEILSGETVTVEVSIAGLVGGAAPSVGAVDLHVTYDPGILSLVGPAFGSELGDVGVESRTIFEENAPGDLRVFQLSLLSPDGSSCTECSPPYLDVSQPAAFTILTLTFTGGSDGSTILRAVPIIASDAEGAPLALSGSNSFVTVPEPAIGVGLGVVSAVVTLAGTCRRTRRHVSPRDGHHRKPHDGSLGRFGRAGEYPWRRRLDVASTSKGTLSKTE